MNLSTSLPLTSFLCFCVQCLLIPQSCLKLWSFTVIRPEYYTQELFKCSEQSRTVTLLWVNIKSVLVKPRIVYINNLLLDPSVLRSKKAVPFYTTILYWIFSRSIYFYVISSGKHLSWPKTLCKKYWPLQCTVYQNVICTHGDKYIQLLKAWHFCVSQCYLKEL